MAYLMHFIKSPTTLDLRSNSIGDEGARALSQCNLCNLTFLNLGGNDIGHEGAQALSHGNFSNLLLYIYTEIA
jgi:hypothetical protein